VLLESLRFQRCATCQLEHARTRCPDCAAAGRAGVKEVARVRGRVTARCLFSTRGIILASTVQAGKLLVLHSEDGVLRREDGTAVADAGKAELTARYRLMGSTTLVGTSGELVALTPGMPPRRFRLDGYRNRPMFDANRAHFYWLENGRLLKDGRLGPEQVGDVLEGQTLFWVGPRFGLGLYRAGALSVAFVFDARCLFDTERAFLLTSAREHERFVHRCIVIRPDGEVEAAAEAERDDGSWLGQLRGKCAASGFLFTATDDGLVRVEVEGGSLAATRHYQDTESFVDAGSRICAGPQGIYVVGKSEIRLLTTSC
jgi:hypothetical protein